MQEVFDYSIKIWKLLREHIRECHDTKCCVGQIIDSLDLEKKDVVWFIATQTKQPARKPNSLKVGDP